MKKKNGLLKNQIISALVLVVISISLIFVYNNTSKPKKTIARELTTPIDMAAIDSASCIACHTSDQIIASLAVVSDASAHGAEGG